jgi:hypothetical protein
MNYWAATTYLGIIEKHAFNSPLSVCNVNGKLLFSNKVFQQLLK